MQDKPPIPRLLRLRYFVWLLVPAGFLMIHLAMGLPHFIWSYSFRDNGTYDPRAQRHYTRCTFIGPYGAFTTYPGDGNCEWIRLFKRDGSA